MRVPDPLQVDHDVPAAVEAHLAAVLGRRTEEAPAVDPEFAADIAGRVADFALTGGRRLRAEFLWWAMRGCGGGAAETPSALGVAAALELVQTCALIHDDVMDGSPLRRGRPAVHVGLDARFGTRARELPCGTFGAAAAVLAGDLALAWADDVFAESVGGRPPAARAAAVWRAMRTEMVAGQYLDLRSRATGDRSAGRAERTAVLKTALYSVGHPLVLGATLAGAPGDTARRLREAGRSAGLAFQLYDDVRGAFGDPAATGKPAGEDIREGRATYLLAVAGERCAELGDRAGLDLLERITGGPGRAGARAAGSGSDGFGPEGSLPDGLRADGAPPAGPPAPGARGAGPRATEEDVRRVLDLLVTCGARDRVARRIEELCGRGAEAVARTGLSPEAADRIGALFRRACGLDPSPAGGSSSVGGPASAGRPAPAGDSSSTGRPASAGGPASTGGPPPTGAPAPAAGGPVPVLTGEAR
ncbi:polyprenyl synthetase family protein [Streptomyces sp. NPDC001744]|uniref:polyprenyl synthetase family protein n=1 Tax=Streptomyces sp. NPDC001744 TaxID=3364606 RepID=UPI0036C4EEA5